MSPGSDSARSENLDLQSPGSRDHRHARGYAPAEGGLVARDRSDMDALVDHAPWAILRFGIAGNMVSANPAAARSLGYDVEELLALTLADLVHPDDRHPELWAQAAVGDLRSYQAEARVRHRDGRWRWISVAFQLMPPVADDEPSIIVQAVDITEQKNVQADLRELVDLVDQAIVLLDRDRRVEAINSAALEILGLPDAVEGNQWPALVDRVYRSGGEPLGRDETALGRALGRGEIVTGERYLYLHPDGTDRQLLVSARPLEANPGRVALLLSDISSQTAELDRYRHAALHDPLTDLPNRVLLHDRLHNALAQRNRAVTVAFVDLDHLKTINDSYGHIAGDIVLTTVADRLRTAVRQGDTVARFGGDEFVIVADGSDSPEDQAELGDRLLHAVLAPVTIDHDTIVHPTVSVGIASSGPEDTESSLSQLLRRADNALFSAKQRGRNTFVVT